MTWVLLLAAAVLEADRAIAPRLAAIGVTAAGIAWLAATQPRV